MEDFVLLSFSLVLLAITLSLFMSFPSRPRRDGDVKLPPGSFGWPVVGETIEFLSRKPEKFVRDRMRKYSCDAFKTNILGEKTVVICGPNGHKFLFSNEQKLFNVFRPHSIQRLFRSYKRADQQISQEEAAVIRQPGFLKPEALMRFLGKMDYISQQQLLEWDGKIEVKAFLQAKKFTLTLACAFFMGIDNPKRIARLVDYFDAITSGMHSITLNIPGTVFHRANKAASAIRKEIVSVIRDKKNEMAKGTAAVQDILSHMIVATDQTENSMVELEITDKIMGLLVAGYSTVATTITFLMKYVGDRPEIYNKIRQEQMEIAALKKPGDLLEWEDMHKMKYSWNVVCETMRLTPPLQGTFREALLDFTYAGYTIPKGWKIYWTVSTTNKNPAYFRDSEKFDPSRYEEGEAPAPYTYIPFGGGPRTCPGKEYARLAILSFVHNVVKKYKWDVLIPHEKIIGDMMPTPEKGLPIRLHQHD